MRAITNILTVLASSLLFLYLSACTAVQPAPTPTPLPPTATPTATTVPTDTVTPTPIPTATPTVTPTPLTRLEVVAEWKKGDRRTLEIVQERQDIRSGVTQSAGPVRMGAEIVVLDVTDDGYVLEWTYGKVEFDNPAAAANPLVSELLSLSEGMRIEYETDETGAYLDLRNWNEIQVRMAAIFDALKEQLKKSGLPEDQVDQIMDETSRVFSTKEGFEATSIDEIQLYHFLLGGTYGLNRPVEYEDVLPNPLGGEPFPSQAEIVFKEYDADSGHAIFEWRQTLDPERTTAILLETMIELMRRLGTPTPEEPEVPDFVIEDRATFVVDVETGWAVLVEYTRRTTIGAERRVETMSIYDKTQ